MSDPVTEEQGILSTVEDLVRQTRSQEWARPDDVILLDVSSHRKLKAAMGYGKDGEVASQPHVLGLDVWLSRAYSKVICVANRHRLVHSEVGIVIVVDGPNAILKPHREAEEER